MSSSKPSPRARIYQPPLAKHRERFQSWVDLLKKGLSHMMLNNLFFFNILFLDKIIFHLIMQLIIIRPKNKIPALPAKAGEKPMVFQLFQPISEKGLIFQLFQHFQPEWTRYLSNKRHSKNRNQSSGHCIMT